MTLNAQTLTKEKISELIQNRLGFSAKEARELLEIVLEQIKNELENGNEVKVSGFGKWLVKNKSQDQEEILILVDLLKYQLVTWLLSILQINSELQ